MIETTLYARARNCIWQWEAYKAPNDRLYLMGVDRHGLLMATPEIVEFDSIQLIAKDCTGEYWAISPELVSNLKAENFTKQLLELITIPRWHRLAQNTQA
jgi:hypothetical protein